MPQLMPFTYLNTIITLIVFLGIVIWVFYVIVLPLFPRLQLSRLFIINL